MEEKRAFMLHTPIAAPKKRQAEKRSINNNARIPYQVARARYGGHVFRDVRLRDEGADEDRDVKVGDEAQRVNEAPNALDRLARKLRSDHLFFSAQTVK